MPKFANWIMSANDLLTIFGLRKDNQDLFALDKFKEELLASISHRTIGINASLIDALDKVTGGNEEIDANIIELEENSDVILSIDRTISILHKMKESIENLEGLDDSDRRRLINKITKRIELLEKTKDAEQIFQDREVLQAFFTDENKLDLRYLKDNFIGFKGMFFPNKPQEDTLEIIDSEASSSAESVTSEQQALSTQEDTEIPLEKFAEIERIFQLIQDKIREGNEVDGIDRIQGIIDHLHELQLIIESLDESNTQKTKLNALIERKIIEQTKLMKKIEGYEQRKKDQSSPQTAKISDGFQRLRAQFRNVWQEANPNVDKEETERQADEYFNTFTAAANNIASRAQLQKMLAMLPTIDNNILIRFLQKINSEEIWQLLQKRAKSRNTSLPEAASAEESTKTPEETTSNANEISRLQGLLDGFYALKHYVKKKLAVSEENAAYKQLLTLARNLQSHESDNIKKKANKILDTLAPRHNPPKELPRDINVVHFLERNIETDLFDEILLEIITIQKAMDKEHNNDPEILKILKTLRTNLEKLNKLFPDYLAKKIDGAKTKDELILYTKRLESYLKGELLKRPPTINISEDAMIILFKIIDGKQDTREQYDKDMELLQKDSNTDPAIINAITAAREQFHKMSATIEASHEVEKSIAQSESEDIASEGEEIEETTAHSMFLQPEILPETKDTPPTNTGKEPMPRVPPGLINPEHPEPNIVKPPPGLGDSEVTSEDEQSTVYSEEHLKLQIMLLNNFLTREPVPLKDLYSNLKNILEMLSKSENGDISEIAIKILENFDKNQDETSTFNLNILFTSHRLQTLFKFIQDNGHIKLTPEHFDILAKANTELRSTFFMFFTEGINTSKNIEELQEMIRKLYTFLRVVDKDKSLNFKASHTVLEIIHKLINNSYMQTSEIAEAINKLDQDKETADSIKEVLKIALMKHRSLYNVSPVRPIPTATPPPISQPSHQHADSEASTEKPSGFYTMFNMGMSHKMNSAFESFANLRRRLPTFGISGLSNRAKGEIAESNIVEGDKTQETQHERSDTESRAAVNLSAIEQEPFISSRISSNYEIFTISEETLSDKILEVCEDMSSDTITLSEHDNNIYSQDEGADEEKWEMELPQEGNDSEKLTLSGSQISYEILIKSALASVTEDFDINIKINFNGNAEKLAEAFVQSLLNNQDNEAFKGLKFEMADEDAKAVFSVLHREEIGDATPEKIEKLRANFGVKLEGDNLVPITDESEGLNKDLFANFTHHHGFTKN